MIGKVVASLVTFALVFSMVVIVDSQTKNSADAQFQDLSAHYLEDYLPLNPEAATQLGDHRFDERLDDYSRSGFNRRLTVNRIYLQRLTAIPFKDLSRENSVDYRLLKNRLESGIFSLETLREFLWNPLNYNVGSSIYALVSREFAPLIQRLKSVKGRLEAVPGVCQNAKRNLKNPPRIYTETAIAQNKGNISLVKSDLQQFIDREPSMKPELSAAQATAITALEDYGTWLEKELLPQSNGDFRLGDEKYRKKLAFSLESDLTKEQILEHAQSDLIATQSTMYDVALPLYKKYFPAATPEQIADRKLVIKAVLGKLAEQHPTNDTIVEQARNDLKTTTDFVREKRLVTLPSEPVKAIVMPEYARGVAVAYCDAAGALEKNGQTYFDIAPTPKDWSPERVESFFKEYNDYMVQDLTIHEAMPGHYLQLAHAAKFNAPTKLRAIFESGTFIEGWAVYAEQLMAENGYGGPEVRMQQLKMRLRTIINAILDQKIHTENMSENEAMALMMDEGFQEEGEAAGKWKRAQLSSTQLSTYYVGMVEVNDIRHAYEAKAKGKVDYMKMHDLMLSFGSPAPRYVKELMGL